MFFCHKIQDLTLTNRTLHGLCLSHTRWHYVVSSQTPAYVELQCVNFFFFLPSPLSQAKVTADASHNSGHHPLKL